MPAVIDSSAIQAVFAQPRSDGTFEGATLAYLKEVGARRNILFLAFAPKAAGTFFRQAATYAIGGDVFRMAHALGGRDGTPYLPNMLACYLDPDLPQIVAHIHMQAFGANRHLLEALNIRPIIMLRSIPDMLASFWDMLETDPVARAEGLNCVVPAHFTELDRAAKADFMVDIIAPWYASYFASWKSFADQAPKQVCVLRYRNFRLDPPESFHAALTHAGFTVSRSAAKAALDRASSERTSLRFNKGTEGRGQTYFSSAHVAQIARQLSHYPHLAAWMPDLMGVSPTQKHALNATRAAS